MLGAAFAVTTEEILALNDNDRQAPLRFSSHLSLLQTVSNLWHFEQCITFLFPVFSFFTKESTVCGENCDSWSRQDVEHKDGISVTVMISLDFFSAYILRSSDVG